MLPHAQQIRFGIGFDYSQPAFGNGLQFDPEALQLSFHQGGVIAAHLLEVRVQLLAQT